MVKDGVDGEEEWVRRNERNEGWVKSLVRECGFANMPQAETHLHFEASRPGRPSPLLFLSQLTRLQNQGRTPHGALDEHQDATGQIHLFPGPIWTTGSNSHP